MKSFSSARPSVIPIRFIWRNKLTKDDKLLLAFDALVLGQALGRDIALGKIIHGDPRSCAQASAADAQDARVSETFAVRIANQLPCHAIPARA